MTKPKIALFWAAAMLLVAVAQRFGAVGDGAGDLLFFFLLAGAVAHIGLARPCAACAR